MTGRAVVTGGAGFVGSHLVDRLLVDGWSVLVVDDLSTGSLENLPRGATFEACDIADGELDRPVVAWRPEVVFHLAAQASVPRSHEEPLRDLAVNVIGTHRVVAAARAAGARRLVFMSSGGAVYGERSRPAGERAAPAPTSYYGVHKLAAEGHVAVSGLSYAIARPSNIYGPRQEGGLDGAVVAAFLGQARRDGCLHVHGDGRQTRDLIHVRDAVEALVRLGDPARPAGIWNVASGRSISINALGDRVERALGRSLERRHEARRAGDVDHSAMSSAHLRSIGWRPTVSLTHGLRELVAESGTG